jgi:hypothetical protein
MQDRNADITFNTYLQIPIHQRKSEKYLILTRSKTKEKCLPLTNAE